MKHTLSIFYGTIRKMKHFFSKVKTPNKLASQEPHSTSIFFYYTKKIL
jgi:hypothetical protein